MNQELERIQAFVDGLADPLARLEFCAKIQGIQSKTRTAARRALGAPNYGKRYTEEDRQNIIILTAEGYNKNDIAVALGRTTIGASQQRQKILVQSEETTTSLKARFPDIAETAFEMLAPQHNNLDG